MNRFLNAILGKYRPTKANNRKETKGRSVRKQYVPLYTTDVDKRKKLVDERKKEGVPSYEIERRLRQKRVILHDAA